jgi:DNA polymerase I
MIADYLSGDPYMAYAIAAHLAESGDTAETKPLLRGQCKVVCLGIPYGMTEYAAATQLGVSLPYARALVELHKFTYPVANRWVQEAVHKALLSEIMATKFGWKWRCVPYQTALGYDFPTPRSIRNFNCQANGADMMRAAVVLAYRAGISVVSTMHDALMITAPISQLDADIAATKECMVTAGKALTGFEVRVDEHVVRWPERYMDKDGAVTWNRTIAMLHEVEREN